MSNETPPIRIAVVPFLMFIIVGGTFALMIGAGMIGRGHGQPSDMWFYGAGGVFAGAIVAMWPQSGMVFQLLRSFLPERFNQYEYATELPSIPQEPDEPPVILVYIEERDEWKRFERCGISIEKWVEFSALVHKANAFTQDIFEKVFDSRDIGRQNYRIVGGVLESISILYRFGAGFKIVEHEGDLFFEKLGKGDWRVLEKVPDEAIL